MNKFAAKDSKEQVMQKFQQVLAVQQKLDSKIATKEEEAEKEKNKQILATASNYTVDSIVKGLADLQLEFGSIVNSLAEKLATENAKLDELKQAIEIETKHLQELQQIRIVADVLHILTQEHQEKLKNLAENTKVKQEALEKETVQTRKEWQKEQIAYEQVVQRYNTELAKQRSLETDEYQYKLETTRKINTNAYEAKRRNLERELQETGSEKQKGWTERERILNEQQPLLAEYQQKIASFETELDAAVKKAREEAIKDVTNKAKVESDLFEKEWQGTKQTYELNIQSLEATIQRQSEQIEALTAQLQATLNQAQELAMKAFEAK